MPRRSPVSIALRSAAVVFHLGRRRTRTGRHTLGWRSAAGTTGRVETRGEFPSVQTARRRARRARAVAHGAGIVLGIRPRCARRASTSVARCCAKRFDAGLNAPANDRCRPSVRRRRSSPRPVPNGQLRRRGADAPGGALRGGCSASRIAAGTRRDGDLAERLGATGAGAARRTTHRRLSGPRFSTRALPRRCAIRHLPSRTAPGS